MAQHAQQQVARLLDPTRVPGDGLGLGLVDRLVETHQLVQGIAVGAPELLLPAAHDAGAQRPVFRHHLIERKAFPQALLGVLPRRVGDALGMARAVATRLLMLVLAALRALQIVGHLQQQLPGVVAQLCRRQSPRRWETALCELCPLLDDGVDFVLDEF